MASFTVKNIPDPLFERLKTAADLHHRSINGEILACLEQSLGVTLEPAELLARMRELRALFRGKPLTDDELRAAKTAGRP
jgi:plasmid stability protein